MRLCIANTFFITIPFLVLKSRKPAAAFLFNEIFFQLPRYTEDFPAVCPFGVSSHFARFRAAL